MDDIAVDETKECFDERLIDFPHYKSNVSWVVLDELSEDDETQGSNCNVVYSSNLFCLKRAGIVIFSSRQLVLLAFTWNLYTCIVIVRLHLYCVHVSKCIEK